MPMHCPLVHLELAGTEIMVVGEAVVVATNVMMDMVVLMPAIGGGIGETKTITLVPMTLVIGDLLGDVGIHAEGTITTDTTETVIVTTEVIDTAAILVDTND